MSAHIGRSWPGMGNPIETSCPCPQEPCGLVDTAKTHPDCEQHPMQHGKTIRQSHPAGDCPGEPRPDPDTISPDRHTYALGPDRELYAMRLDGDTIPVQAVKVDGFTFTADSLRDVKPGDVLHVVPCPDGWRLLRLRYRPWRFWARSDRRELMRFTRFEE